MRHRWLLSAFAALLAMPAVTAAVSGLYVYDFDEVAGDVIWEVDEAIPSSINPVARDRWAHVTGFEYANGVFYAANSSTNTELLTVDPGSGAMLSTTTMIFPGGGNVITSLEYVNGTLYGGFAGEDNRNGSSSLVTIDPLGGGVTLIGEMGIDSPTGGLAWDGSSLYTVNSRAGGPAMLYTVNIESGAASPVGAVLDTTGTPVGLTGLEFGLDGLLYGLGRSGQDDGALFRIDPATGLAERLGYLESRGSLTSITAVPEPGVLTTLILGLALWCVRRRR